jgi:aspartate/methionine/tyrosine aminotransferase
MFSIWGKDEFESVLQFEELPNSNRTHVVWSFSKDFCMSGMRVGVLM